MLEAIPRAPNLNALARRVFHPKELEDPKRVVEAYQRSGIERQRAASRSRGEFIVLLTLFWGASLIFLTANFIIPSFLGVLAGAAVHSAPLQLMVSQRASLLQSHLTCKVEAYVRFWHLSDVLRLLPMSAVGG